MDALIFGGWLVLLAALVARRERLGRAAWQDWELATAGVPDDDDATGLGRRALAAVENFAEARHDAALDVQVRALAEFTGATFAGDLRARLQLGRRQVRLLALAGDARPFDGLTWHAPWLRAATTLDAWLARLPGEPRAVARLRRQLTLLSTLALLERVRRAWCAERPRALARVEADATCLEQAAARVQEALERGRQARREQLHGPRH